MGRHKMIPCEILGCKAGRKFKNEHALAVHRARSHKVSDIQGTALTGVAAVAARRPQANMTPSLNTALTTLSAQIARFDESVIAVRDAVANVRNIVGR